MTVFFFPTAVGHDSAEFIAGERRNGIGDVHNRNRRTLQKTQRRIYCDGIPVVLVR